MISKYRKTDEEINLFKFASLGLIVDLSQPLFPQQGIDLICIPQVVVDLSILGLAHGCEFN